MFRQVVEYLRSEGGFGRTLWGVRGMFQDITNETDSDAALHRAIGFTVGQYEAEFYPWVGLYLQEQGTS